MTQDVKWTGASTCLIHPFALIHITNVHLHAVVSCPRMFWHMTHFHVHMGEKGVHTVLGYYMLHVTRTTSGPRFALVLCISWVSAGLMRHRFPKSNSLICHFSDGGGERRQSCPQFFNKCSVGSLIAEGHSTRFPLLANCSMTWTHYYDPSFTLYRSAVTSLSKWTNWAKPAFID